MNTESMVQLPILPLPVVSLPRIKEYAHASGDFNPIHTDPEAARLSGLQGIIAHGMLVMGMAGHALAEWFPGRKLRFWHAAFVDFVFAGERLYVCGSCQSVPPDRSGDPIEGVWSVADEAGRIKLSGRFTMA